MLAEENSFNKLVRLYPSNFYPVVKFNPAKERLLAFDFTEKNIELQQIDLQDTEELGNYISDQLKIKKAKFGYGGYNELRSLYKRSSLFDKDLKDKTNLNLAEEPRRLHIGIDIWGATGTEVFAPLDGWVHSFAYNRQLGDYGATIILLHRLKGLSFFTLYGHVSLKDIANLKEGGYIIRGQKLAHFGKSEENGHWPSHLHFQIIKDITRYRGDYPGVCKLSESKKYLQNSPDPDLILNMKRFITF
ncbi:MAG: peptidoglycan DD-metalloendopeptidase family protein [Ginsengibacter sp.]